MPFTLSHPAAVLPLIRRPFVPAALIIGAMVPDLPYFLKIPVTAESWYEPFVNATFSHSLQGLLLVGLPSVIVIAALFYLVRDPLGDLLPLRLRTSDQERVQPRGAFSFCLWFGISALIGLATHIIWDLLTERGNWVVTRLPFLNVDAETGYTFNRVLQHTSTVLGALIIVIWCVRRFRSHDVAVERVKVSRNWILQRVGIVLSIVLVSAAFAVLEVKQVRDREGSVDMEHAITLFLKAGLRTAAIAIVVYALTWYAVRLLKNLLSRNTNELGSQP